MCLYRGTFVYFLITPKCQNYRGLLFGQDWNLNEISIKLLSSACSLQRVAAKWHFIEVLHNSSVLGTQEY